MRLLRSIVLALSVVAAATPVAGQSAPGPAPSGRGVRDVVELEGFLDGFMTAARNDKHIAGITVSVVKDGQIFFAKGYGYSDVDGRIPVDPAASMFRIGSISKLFTWTAVMQLVEQGKLDLDRDINEYLDFEIPATFPEPITLSHILTHSPGLEEDGRDLFTTDSAHITPMGVWLPAHMPKRVRAAGTFSSYSNWATAVAGYIVERVSGMTYDEYLEKNIIDPLGMSHTTSRQPLPPRFAADMSHGYQWKDGHYESKPWEIITGAWPAGSIGASATDMASFMLAHLGRGALGDVRILSEATADRMHSRLFGHDERLTGFAHGFYEQSSHGLRIIGHGGDTQWFHSDLALMPSENLGVFISTNTDKGSEISFLPFLEAFLDHYYPESRPAITPSEGAKATAQRYAGEYLFNRMSYSTWQKAASLASAMPITVAEDGALLLASPLGALRLVAVDSMLFRDVVSGTLVSFRADEQGRITHGFLSIAPMMVLEKQTGLHRPSLHRNLLGLALVMFVGILIAAVIRFFGRDSHSRPADDRVRLGRRLMVLVALSLGVFGAILAGIAAKPEVLLGDTPALLKLALVFPMVGLGLTLWAAAVGVGQWRLGAGTLAARIRHLGAVAIALAFFWSLYSWNLLGWRF